MRIATAAVLTNDLRGKIHWNVFPPLLFVISNGLLIDSYRKDPPKKYANHRKS